MTEIETIVIEELEQLVEKCRDLREEEFYSVFTIHEVQNISTALNLMQRQQEEIKKKDKIINKTVEYIATLDIEDICSKTGNEHCDKMNFGECEDCIKQYFENKVESEDKQC